jgi:hypothetical protein
MSLKKRLGKVLLYVVLEAGALCGVPVRPDEIEELMNRNLVAATQVVRKEDTGDGDEEP